VKQTIADLFKSIEAQNFECQGGPLKNFVAYKIIKDMLYDRMMEPIPDKYVTRFGLDYKADPGDVRELGGDE
jgi:hypothetical protein